MNMDGKMIRLFFKIYWGKYFSLNPVFGISFKSRNQIKSGKVALENKKIQKRTKIFRSRNFRQCTIRRACSKDSDQPVHLCSLIRMWTMKTDQTVQMTRAQLFKANDIVS